MIFEYLTNARENFFSKTGDNSIVKSNIEEFTGKAERFCDTLNKWKRPLNYLCQIF